MKKLLTILAIMFCVHAAKAQVQILHVTNTAGIANLIFAYQGSDGTAFPCAGNNDGSAGPLTPGVTYTFDLVSGPAIPWTSPTPVATEFIGFTFKIIPPGDGGTGINFCSMPSSPTTFTFVMSGLTYTLNLTPGAPNEWYIEIL